MPEVRVDLTEHALRILEDLAGFGIYGRNPEEVAARFIDRALMDFVEKPFLRDGELRETNMPVRSVLRGGPVTQPREHLRRPDPNRFVGTSSTSKR